MEVLLKCAACGTEVTFESDSPSAEATCPGCEVYLRRRSGDERMAIPIGMELPEEFQQVDLSSLAKQSSVLIDRYRKTPLPAPGGPTMGHAGTSVDATLAKALETLAHTIGHLDERLTRQERQGSGAAEIPPPSPRELVSGEQEEGPDYVVLTPDPERISRGGRNGQNNGGNGPGPLAEPEGVVQLQPEAEAIRAQPLRAPVLVRREAAREAHNFRRERQQFWDDRGREQVKEGLFQRLMQVAPKTTVTTSILLVISITVGVVLFMDPTFRGRGQEVTVLEPTKTTTLGQLWAEDPEAAQAELIARGYLNATSARMARPYVFESESLGAQFDRQYHPIESPDDYGLALKSRVRAPGGEGSIFAYRVSMSSGASRMLVVLPEGKMPKVFWQFIAEVGDLTWDDYMKQQPGEATMMRVWAEESAEYIAPYTPDRWKAYILHDYEDQHRLHAYVERNAGPDWKLANALEKNPRKFGRRTAVMAQVSLTFMSQVTDAEQQRRYVVEIKDVKATDWLPSRFRAHTGPTVEESELSGEQ